MANAKLFKAKALSLNYDQQIFFSLERDIKRKSKFISNLQKFNQYSKSCFYKLFLKLVS